jgi:predicted ATP-grasp superfamily ATP-dependent carboligase
MRRMVESTTDLYESLVQRRVNALVLDAGLRQSLVTVRSLGRARRSVAAADVTSNVPAFASRWCSQSFAGAFPIGGAQQLRFVEDLLDATGARVVIPSHDGTIALLRQHRSRLEQRVRIALANETALDIAVNKERTLEIAERLGIRIPHGVVVRTPAETAEAIRHAGLPAVVKPNESWVGDQRLASELVTTMEEARRAIVKLTANGGSALVQKFLPGRREAVSLFYANDQIFARFAQWAKRTAPPLGGESVLRQSIAVPDDIGAQAERLVREIALDGYSEVEFRRDQDGVPYLMEINPRLSASVEVAVRSGVDFPLMLYRWAMGEPIDKVESYRTGKWMRHLKGDITSALLAVRQKGRPGIARPVNVVAGFVSSFFRPMAYDYFQWTDPLPAVIATTGFTRYALKRVLSGREA